MVSVGVSDATRGSVKTLLREVTRKAAMEVAAARNRNLIISAEGWGQDLSIDA